MMDGIFNKNFLDGFYRKHRENVLFEREKAMLPETMPHVEKAIKLRDARAEFDRLIAVRDVIWENIEDLQDNLRTADQVALHMQYMAEMI
jgi:hypothetical protein